MDECKVTLQLKEQTLQPHRAMLLLAVITLLTVACRDFHAPVEYEWGPPPPADPVELVQALASAYRAQDFRKFSRFLAEDFTFVLDHPNLDSGEAQWNVATERRIHSRMFDPESIQPPDVQLSPANRLQTVAVTLSPRTAFVEIPDLYTSFDPPGPLDSARWIAHGAAYNTDVLFDLEGGTRYQITGRAYFVVIEDRTKQIGAAGKVLLFQWEDLGRDPSAETEERSWTDMKELYN